LKADVKTEKIGLVTSLGKQQFKMNFWLTNSLNAATFVICCKNRVLIRIFSVKTAESNGLVKG
jgi:hypothetical protein